MEILTESWQVKNQFSKEKKPQKKILLHKINVYKT